jgi:hypothetical protein
MFGWKMEERARTLANLFEYDLRRAKVFKIYAQKAAAAFTTSSSLSFETRCCIHRLKSQPQANIAAVHHFRANGPVRSAATDPQRTSSESDEN